MSGTHKSIADRERAFFDAILPEFLRPPSEDEFPTAESDPFDCADPIDAAAWNPSGHRLMLCKRCGGMRVAGRADQTLCAPCALKANRNLSTADRHVNRDRSKNPIQNATPIIALRKYGLARSLLVCRGRDIRHNQKLDQWQWSFQRACRTRRASRPPSKPGSLQ